MSSKNKVRLKGQLDRYYKFQVMVGLLFLAACIISYTIDIRAGILSTVVLAVYFFVATALYFYSVPKIGRQLVEFGAEYSRVQTEMLRQFEFPYGLLDDNKIVWANNKFIEMAERGNVKSKDITAIFPELSGRDFLPDGNSDSRETKIRHEGRSLRIKVEKFVLKRAFENSGLADLPTGKSYFASVCIIDETLIDKLQQENREDKLCTGLIYIDNYEEAMNSVEPVKRSLLVALIERKINKYISSLDGIVQRIEKDKYFIAIKAKYVQILQNNKFSLLEEVKAVNIGNEMAVTVSIGLGMGGNTYEKNCELARSAMEMALGRGGDQAVIRNGSNTTYYGGKTKSVEKNNRVKSRVNAHALKEIAAARSRVFIMGHKMGDADSFGASIGLYKAIKTLNKEVHIVINEISATVRQIYDRFGAQDGYEEDLFVNSSEALDIYRKGDLVIVVDVNKPSLTECPELLNADAIVVLDHHRQGSEKIEGALLSYIETYASSACELVTEIIQYFDEYIKLKQQEADALYSGIIIDTNNFSNRTGVRTFEAAAFLRKSGADVSRVRKMFRDDMADYKAKAEAIRNSEIFMDLYAIAVCPAGGLESPTVVGAQTANELLNIKGVRASFVVTAYNDQMYISARSIDEVNVQLVMEKFGGGGHINLAGAQLKGCTEAEAVNLIKKTLRTMIEEGEI